MLEMMEFFLRNWLIFWGLYLSYKLTRFVFVGFSNYHRTEVEKWETTGRAEFHKQLEREQRLQRKRKRQVTKISLTALATMSPDDFDQLTQRDNEF